MNALGLIRTGLPNNGADLHELARKHGHRLVYTVFLDIGPLISGLVVAQKIVEYDAVAVVVPRFEHAETEREVITDLAALITPMQVYYRGHHWPGIESKSQWPL